MNGIPSRLYENCLNFLCQNIDSVCTLVDVSSSTCKQNTNSKCNKQLVFKDKSIKINHIVCEDILERLCDLGKLNDLTISLFSSKQTCFKNVRIKNASISKESVKLLLKQHQITDLLINNLQINENESQNASNDSHHLPITINDLIDSLNPWSLEHLSSLNVSRHISLFGSILINLHQLRNLLKLNVSYTCFNNHSLDIISQDLPNLEYLDMSGTRVSDISGLVHLKNLKYLLMYNMRASLTDEIVNVICSLTRLQHLDVSCDVSTKLFADVSLSQFDVNLLLDQLTKYKLDDLKHLDISGKTEIKRENLQSFLQSYPDLKFIGLALTNAHSFDFVLNLNATRFRLSQRNQLIVTGESTESQLIASLKYYKTRHLFVQKALNRLFVLTRNFQEARVDLLVLIVDLMHFHKLSQSVQLAATSCIFNLTWQKLNLTPCIPNYILTQIINTILNTMQHFPNTYNLQKNCLLMLRNEKLLKSCPFNKYDCVKVTLDCIVIYNDQDAMINSAIGICSRVALNAEDKYRVQYKKLAEPKYAQKLVGLINASVDHFSNDLTLYNLLDIIIALSENCFEWCCLLVTQNFLSTCCNAIKCFENDSIVLEKTIHLIFNMSHMEEIRPILFNHPISNLAKKLICHSEIKISFLAVGYFCFLLTYLPENDWDWHDLILNTTTKEMFCDSLELIMNNWNEDLHLENCLNNRAYNSAIKLLKLTNHHVAQMWSLLTIHSFIQKNCKSQMNSDILEALNAKEINRQAFPKVSKLCDYLIQAIQNPICREDSEKNADQY